MTATSRIVLVGHCGPDMFLLKTAVGRLVPGLEIDTVNDRARLDDLDGGAVLLVNRVLDGRFGNDSGVELIRDLAARDDPPVMLLISNLDEAQEAAVEAGARPGFGKSQLYDETTAERLQQVVDT